jgi:hypothetical protein
MSTPSSFKASLMLRMVARSSRNKTWLDKLCRKMINRAVARPPEDDFMRDELIDNDLGFDPDELDRFQRGK